MSLLCRGLHVFKKIIINHYGNCTAGADPGIFDGGGGGGANFGKDCLNVFWQISGI